MTPKQLEAFTEALLNSAQSLTKVALEFKNNSDIYTSNMAAVNVLTAIAKALILCKQ